jgi:hypothetical protein
MDFSIDTLLSAIGVAKTGFTEGAAQGAGLYYNCNCQFCHWSINYLQNKEN